MVATKLVISSDLTLLTDDDLYLFNEKSRFNLYEKLGSHQTTIFPEKALPVTLF